MKITNHLIAAFSYFLLVVFVEVGLYFLAQSMPVIGQYSMWLTIALFFVVAWLLKLRLIAVAISAVLIALYGVLSFYSDFPAYFIGYPESIEEFLPVIGAKTAYFSLPIVAYLVAAKK